MIVIARPPQAGEAIRLADSGDSHENRLFVIPASPVLDTGWNPDREGVWMVGSSLQAESG